MNYSEKAKTVSSLSNYFSLDEIKLLQIILSELLGNCAFFFLFHYNSKLLSSFNFFYKSRWEVRFTFRNKLIWQTKNKCQKRNRQHKWIYEPFVGTRFLSSC